MRHKGLLASSGYGNRKLRGFANGFVALIAVSLPLLCDRAARSEIAISNPLTTGSPGGTGLVRLGGGGSAYPASSTPKWLMFSSGNIPSRINSLTLSLNPWSQNPSITPLPLSTAIGVSVWSAASNGSVPLPVSTLTSTQQLNFRIDQLRQLYTFDSNALGGIGALTLEPNSTYGLALSGLVSIKTNDQPKWGYTANNGVGLNPTIPTGLNGFSYLGFAITQNDGSICTAYFLDDPCGLTSNAVEIEVTLLGITPGMTTNASNPASTLLSGGTVLVNESGTFSTDYILTPLGGTIDANGLASTFSGVQSGVGPLTITNSGEGGDTIFSGVSTYTGSTTIASGAKLSVNGSIASSSGVAVNSGGTIGGSGNLPQTNLVSGARIAPGNSIGTITVGGLDLNGGTIDAEIQGPQNDRINITGQVTNFTGTANLTPYGGGSPWPNFTYTIVSAPNSAGFATSSSLTLDQSGVTSALLRSGTTLIQNADGDPKTFDVQWRPRNGSGATASAMQTLGQGYSNQLATAGAVDRVFRSLATNAANNANNTGSLIGSTGFTSGQAAAAGISADFLSATSQLLSLTNNSQLNAAINSLSPEPYAAFQSVGLDTLKRQRELLLSQAGNCTSTGWVINASSSKKGKQPKQPLCVFGQVANATSAVNGQNGLSSYDSGIFSTFYGVEYKPAKRWTIGAAYGYGSSYLNNMALTNALVSSGVNSGSLYGVYKPSASWTVRGLFGYSNFNSSGSRNVAYVGNGSPITATPTANGYTAAINADYLIQLSKPTAKTTAYLKPLLGVAWGGYQQGSFSEVSSGSLPLNVDGNTANSLMGTVGLELFSSPIGLNRAKTRAIIPRLAIAYQVDAFGNYTNVKSLTSSFAQAPAAGSFTTEGENRGVNTLSLDGGVEFQVASNASLYANVGYEAFSTGAQLTYGGGFKVKL